MQQPFQLRMINGYNIPVVSIIPQEILTLNSSIISQLYTASSFSTCRGKYTAYIIYNSIIASGGFGAKSIQSPEKLDFKRINFSLLLKNLSFLTKNLSFFKRNLSFLRKNLSFLIRNLSFFRQNLSFFTKNLSFFRRNLSFLRQNLSYFIANQSRFTGSTGKNWIKFEQQKINFIKYKSNL